MVGGVRVMELNKEIKSSLMEDAVWERIGPLCLTCKKVKVE